MTTYLGDTPQTMWQKVMFARSFNAVESTDQQWYSMLENYYLNNALYEGVNFVLKEDGIWMEGMHPLRNPANRAVEFHVSHLWPGPLNKALPIISENEAIIPAIQQVWKWSNFGTKKQLGARWFAEFGNMFIKVATKSDAAGKVQKVVESFIKPENVIDFELDDYGFITYIRIDVTSSRTVNGTEENYTHTEIWDKAESSYRMYEHQFGQGADMVNLGDPKDVKTLADFKIDFIPIVHAKFRDTGNDRGDAVFVHALDKIDEANRMATRLHNLLFRYNKATEVITAGGNDQSGKPLPPPAILDGDGNQVQSGDDFDRTDHDLMLLPGNADVKQLVPQLQYAEALAILNAMMEELEQDLPEMAYYRMKDKGDLSGRAVRLMLSDAIDRAVEARGNGETAIIRANQIALTLGAIHGLEGFSNIGTYTDGSFEHTFSEREVIPVSAIERAEAVKMDTDAGIPVSVSLKQHGASVEQIKDLEESPEYRMRVQKLFYELVDAANTAGVPLETALLEMGWDQSKLKDFGTQKLADIKLKQEDVIPEVGQ